jgi:N-acetylneuraminic acid mutarotase
MKMVWCGVFIAIALFVSTAYSADDWTQRFPVSHPSARVYPEMAFIGGDKILLFGGYTTADNNETWLYDLSDNTWTQKFPASSPSARREHGMAYIGGDQVLLFGGDNGATETWVYDLSENTWTNKNPPGDRPGGRAAMGLAYIGGDQALLFGGSPGSGVFNDTWIYDLSDNSWTLIDILTRPSARRGHGMASIGEDRVLIFGGDDGSYNLKNDTWVFDLSDSSWTAMSPASKPTHRWGHALAYIGGDQVLFFGGADGSGIYHNDTWVYDLSEDNWTLDSNSVQPSERKELALSETSMDGSGPIVLFGGIDTSNNDETWAFGGGDYPLGWPQVDLVSPNGGELFKDSLTITWVATDPVPGDSAILMIDLDYSADAGTSWTAIDSGQANDGSYLWDISEVVSSSHGLIRLTAVDTMGLSDSDESDAVFTLDGLGAPQVDLLFPDGGDTLVESAAITWWATDPDPGDSALLLVDLNYSADAGTSWTSIASNLPNSGSYFWDLYGFYSGTQYLVSVAVTDTIDQLFNTDVSDSLFTIINNNSDWTQQFPASKPSARTYQAMAYIGGDRVLLFGGYDTSNDDETWIYDLSAGTWTQKFPDPHPSSRRQHDMAYIGDDKVLLFGGEHGTVEDNQTWVYDLSMNTWTRKYPASAPSARDAHAMAYIGGDRVLLFGGRKTDTTDDETWVYDLSDDTWSQKSVSPRPGVRRCHTMAYIGGDKVLLFGGEWGIYFLRDDTWVYDLSDNSWTQQAPASKPSARWGPVMDYLGDDRVMLFGGDGSGGLQNDTWVYDLSEGDWTEDLNTSQPSARKEHGLAATSMVGPASMVLFGGYDGSNDDETWVFGGGDYPVGHSPQVSVTYPGGGEVLGDSVTITWAATDPDPGETAQLLVDLDYSSDAGTTWTAIDSGQANDGSYLWDISELVSSSEGLVHITATDTAGLIDFDESDAVFTIDALGMPQVTLLFPDGGETLGDSATITWWATDPDPGDSVLLLVGLSYSADAGTSWTSIASSLPNSGSYFWDLYGIYSGTEYLISIGVTDTVDQLFNTDASDSLFTVRKPEPYISSITDVPEDQGRQVAVLWDRSYLDEYPNQVITHYTVWRKYPEGSKIESLGVEWDGSIPKDRAQLVYRRIVRENALGGIKTEYWEPMGTVTANYFEGYAFISPTLYDSSASGPEYFSFIVTANTADPFVHWDSAPDSGYSVDDVEPAKTQVGILASGSAKGAVNTIWLSWEQVTAGEDGSAEQGPIEYRIYCGESPAFTPGPGNLLTTISDLSYAHTDSRIGDPAANLFYLVTATDGSGNESAVSNLVGEFDRDLGNVK